VELSPSGPLRQRLPLELQHHAGAGRAQLQLFAHIAHEFRGAADERSEFDSDIVNEIVLKHLAFLGGQQCAAIDDFLSQQETEVVHPSPLALKKDRHHQHIVIRRVLGAIVVTLESIGYFLHVVIDRFLIPFPGTVAVIDRLEGDVDSPC